ncbi:MAG: RsfS/YbeB/iojap family protein, partial [Spirochaetota bacterium]
METELRNKVLRLAALLREWKAENTVVLRLDPGVSWARYCLISTCNSLTHMRGILNHLRSGFSEEELWNMLRYIPRQGDPWCPVDLGDVVL